MSLTAKIDDDLTQALRDKNETSKNVLRGLKTAIKNLEINLGHELSDDEIEQTIKKEVKKRHESIELYKQANRPELAENEQAELDILSTYLPEQLSEEDIKKHIESAFTADESLKDENRGKLIGRFVGELKGKADGSLVAKIINQILS